MNIWKLFWYTWIGYIKEYNTELDTIDMTPTSKYFDKKFEERIKTNIEKNKKK